MGKKYSRVRAHIRIHCSCSDDEDDVKEVKEKADKPEKESKIKEIKIGW